MLDPRAQHLLKTLVERYIAEGQPVVRHDGNSAGLTTNSDPAPPSPLALFCKRHTRGYQGDRVKKLPGNEAGEKIIIPAGSLAPAAQ